MTLTSVRPKLVSVGEATKLPRIVSLFSGAGGLDYGFSQAGFNIAAAFDSSAAAIDTHRHNFSDSSSFVTDLAELGGDGVYKLLKPLLDTGTAIGVIGGPPCQGFSRANTSSRADDPRNLLAEKYLEIVKKLNRHFPVQFVVLENVLGIRDSKHLATYRRLVETLKAMKFDTYEHELCALDFGVPQLRRRVVVVAVRPGRARTDLQIINRPGKTSVREAIGKLPPPTFFRRRLKDDDISYHPNHWTMRPLSKKFRQSPEEWTRGTRSFRLLSWDKPSPTVAYGHREIHIHPSATRRLSIHEAMLIQGFPGSFVLKGTFSDQVEQVSNAVPPPLAKAIAEAVARSLASRRS
jgi:DNA (cytosine-5)-methyltransferase 1